MVGDGSARVAMIDVAGSPLVRYDIAVDEAEGIAVDPASGRVFVIGDSASRPYELVRP